MKLLAPIFFSERRAHGHGQTCVRPDTNSKADSCPNTNTNTRLVSTSVGRRRELTDL
jgi:hypothetical protein